MKNHILSHCLITCFLLTPNAHASTTDSPFHRLVISGHIQALVKSQQDHQLVELMGPKDQLAHVTISNHHVTTMSSRACVVIIMVKSFIGGKLLPLS